MDAAVKVIVMRGECGADSPFWTEDGHFIPIDTLPLPRSLQESAERWAIGLDRARANDASEAEEADWRAAGLLLHAQVVASLSPRFKVINDI